MKIRPLHNEICRVQRKHYSEEKSFPFISLISNIHTASNRLFSQEVEKKES
jgi:hypothetical protein